MLTLGHAALSALLGASRQIALMREYRTRLIADVVTGKVDVRDVPVEEEVAAIEEGIGARESVELDESGTIGLALLGRACSTELRKGHQRGKTGNEVIEQRGKKGARRAKKRLTNAS